MNRTYVKQWLGIICVSCSFAMGAVDSGSVIVSPVARNSGAVSKVASDSGLTFASTHLQFEATQGDEKIEGIFKFSNTSEQTVNILDIKSSCGCTVPNLEKRTYAPGESGEIKAVFTIGSRVGNQKKRIGVKTDDTEEMITLLLETNITEPVKIRPRFVLWSDETTAKEVTITIDSEDEIVIHAIDVNRGFAYQTQVKKPGELYKILITPPEGEVSVRGFMNIEMKNVTQDKLLPRTGVHLRVRHTEHRTPNISNTEQRASNTEK